MTEALISEIQEFSKSLYVAPEEFKVTLDGNYELYLGHDELTDTFSVKDIQAKNGGGVPGNLNLNVKPSLAVKVGFQGAPPANDFFAQVQGVATVNVDQLVETLRGFLDTYCAQVLESLEKLNEYVNQLNGLGAIVPADVTVRNVLGVNLSVADLSAQLGHATFTDEYHDAVRVPGDRAPEYGAAPFVGTRLDILTEMKRGLRRPVANRDVYDQVLRLPNGVKSKWAILINYIGNQLRSAVELSKEKEFLERDVNTTSGLGPVAYFRGFSERVHTLVTNFFTLNQADRGTAIADFNTNFRDPVRAALVANVLRPAVVGVPGLLGYKDVSQVTVLQDPVSSAFNKEVVSRDFSKVRQVATRSRMTELLEDYGALCRAEGYLSAPPEEKLLTDLESMLERYQKEKDDMSRKVVRALGPLLLKLRDRKRAYEASQHMKNPKVVAVMQGLTRFLGVVLFGSRADLYPSIQLPSSAAAPS